jgi:hypothetical protein
MCGSNPCLCSNSCTCGQYPCVCINNFVWNNCQCGLNPCTCIKTTCNRCNRIKCDCHMRSLMGNYCICGNSYDQCKCIRSANLINW